VNRPGFKWVRFAIGILITSIALWLVLRQVSIANLAAALRHLQYSSLVIALASLAIGYATRIYRWWWIIRIHNKTLTPASCVRPLIVGVAINNIVPFRAGDIVRVMGFRDELGAPASFLIGTLLLERILDLSVLLLILLIGIPGLQDGQIPAMYWRAAELIAGVGAAAWGALLFLPGLAHGFLIRLCQFLTSLAPKWRPAAEAHLREFLTALDIVRKPTQTARLVAMSVVVWVCEGGVFAAVANGLGYSGSPYGPWFALATGSLSTLIPSSPGYVGTFDFFTVSGLTAYGASQSLATAVAFTVHALLWLPLTAIGVIYLQMPLMKGRRRSLVTTQRQENL
jgi:uncharacterized protein (TIRG00374 family)